MPRTIKGPDNFRLSQISSRRPIDVPPGAFSSISLGGTTLYAANSKDLENAVDRIAEAIEASARAHFLLARNMLTRLTLERLGEPLHDRVYGAVLGKSLRLGKVTAIPCLTINARMMRTYVHSSKLEFLERKMDVVRKLLLEGTAVSVEAALAACFPRREWGSSFAAKQMLAHLAYRGEAVFLDQDLFASSLRSLENAIRHY